VPLDERCPRVAPLPLDGLFRGEIARREGVLLEHRQGAGEHPDLVAPLGSRHRDLEIARRQASHQVRHAIERPRDLRHRDPGEKRQGE
jgi:hypothetical protein